MPEFFETAIRSVVEVKPASNRLLGALPRADYRRLVPRLKATALAADAILFEPNRPVEFAYFPIDSVVTLSYPAAEGVMANAWNVGREGLVGVSAFLNDAKHHERAEVQIGGMAFRLSAADLQTEFRRAQALQHLLLRYVLALVTQTSQLCICYRYHTIEQRFCDYLLRTFDEAGGKCASLTQHRVSTLLGVRRESITEVALRLQGDSIIRYHRGQVTLADRGALERRACACGRIIRRASMEVLDS